MIVLPGDWHTWTYQERRVVLAHEIAHIARGDYLAWLLAQVSVALHVYHPLVHWLSGRLRLEQELAADAWAAEVSGGRERYLFTLAQMALRQDDRRVAWAARPFLPSRGTLLRRVEMLSTTQPRRNVPVSRRRAALLATTAVAAGLMVAGIRAPIGGGRQVASAAEPDKPKATAKDRSAPAMDLSYVPPRAAVVLAARPAAIFQNKDMKPLVDLLNDNQSAISRLGVRIEEIEELTIGLTELPIPRSLIDPIVTLRAKRDLDWKPVGDDFIGKEHFGVAPARAGDNTYYKTAEPSPMNRAYFLPDKRTIVMAPEALLLEVVPAADRWARDWGQPWNQLATGACAAMIDLRAVNGLLSEQMKQDPPPPQLASLRTLAPLWEKGQRLMLAANIDEGLRVTARVDCANGEDAKKVRETAQGALTLARNAFDELGKQELGNPLVAANVPLIDLASEIVKQSRLATEQGHVVLSAQLDLDVAETAVTTLTPVILAARTAANRAQSVNNLKQIALAMHVYLDAHQHFPPPVVIGPDGKTPHSWRVAILPFIDQQRLYEQYKLDEPWDSDNNKKVLAKIPALFRHPAADPESTSAGYFALVGAETGLGPKGGEGTKFPAITDGSSQTIAIVEAKRSIPWTKPDDIDYAADLPLPKVGGWFPNGFCAGFCDGHVAFLQDTLGEQTLRALITKAGGDRP